MSRIADLFDRFLNWVAPPPEFLGAEWLSDIEAQHDHLEPDDLWAVLPAVDSPPSEGRSGGRTTRPPLRVVRPADTEPPFGVGGHPLSDHDYIEALVADYREFITHCFRTRGR